MHENILKTINMVCLFENSYSDEKKLSEDSLYELQVNGFILKMQVMVI